jgi:hypothetical protein
VLSMRALVTQAQTNLAGHARLHKVVFDLGFLHGADLWWLDQHRIVFVVPAKDNGSCVASVLVVVFWLSERLSDRRVMG